MKTLRDSLLETYGMESKIPVLDHGHVALIDLMGDDGRIEQAARLSYQQGTRQVSETRGLIRYLMRHKHWSPFEKCVIELDMKMPIFVARQFVRHRTQSINELSGRYSEMPEEIYVPDAEQICYQDKKNRQGREQSLPEGEAVALATRMKKDGAKSFSSYKHYREAGVARETARIGLPLSTYTQWNTTMNLRNLFNFLSLRLDSHAQWEARRYAEAIAQIVKDWVPLAWEAFCDYELESVTFSKQEVEAIAAVLAAHPNTMSRAVALSGLPAREREDFKAKIAKLTS